MLYMATAIDRLKSSLKSSLKSFSIHTELKRKHSPFAQPLASYSPAAERGAKEAAEGSESPEN